MPPFWSARRRTFPPPFTGAQVNALNDIRATPLDEVLHMLGERYFEELRVKKSDVRKVRKVLLRYGAKTRNEVLSGQ